MNTPSPNNVWHRVSQPLTWLLTLMIGFLFMRTSGLFSLSWVYALEGRARAVVISGEEAFFFANGQCKLLYTFSVGNETHVGPSVGGIDFPRRCPDIGSTIDIVFDPSIPAANMWAPHYTHWVGIVIGLLVAAFPLLRLAQSILERSRSRREVSSFISNGSSPAPTSAFTPIPVPALMAFLNKVPRLDEEYGDFSTAQLWELFEDSGVGALHVGNTYESARLFTLNSVLEGEVGHGPQDYGSDPDYVSFDLLPHPSLGLTSTQGTHQYQTYMNSVFQALNSTYGQPTASIVTAGTSFSWWLTGCGSARTQVCIRLAQGARNDIACLWGERNARNARMLSAHEARLLLDRWTCLTWPLSAELFEKNAQTSGWVSDPGSPRRYFLPLVPKDDEAQKARRALSSFPSFPASIVTVLRGAPAPSGKNEPIRGLRFSLAGEADLLDQPTWWPQVEELTAVLSSELTATYGHPSIDEDARGTRASWALPSGGCLSLESGAGRAWVSIHEPDVTDAELRESRYLLSVDETMSVIDSWLSATRPLSRGRATTLLKKAGWVKRRGKAFMTPVSCFGNEGAMLYGSDSDIFAFSFNLAADSHREPHSLATRRIEQQMTALEKTLTSRFGAPDCSAYAGVQYRVWLTQEGMAIRIAFGKGINAVWVYTQDQRANVETIVFPEQVKPHVLSAEDVMYAEQILWEQRVNTDEGEMIDGPGMFTMLVAVPSTLGLVLGTLLIRFLAFSPGL